MDVTIADRNEEAGSDWNIAEGMIDDPEEVRVIYCALDSFSSYARTAHLHCTHLRRQAFYALPQAQWQLLAQPPFSYLDVLDRVDAAIESNAEVCRGILQHGLRAFAGAEAAPGVELTMPDDWAGIAKGGDLDKARSVVRQFYRDWSAAGAVERDLCYGPIYRALDAEQSRYPDRRPLNVLVPGAGLGRLVFELCLRGCHVVGNEISYHQLAASSYILNSTERAGQHTIYPWIHFFSNHRSRENQFRSYPIPDVHPQTVFAQAAEGTLGSMKMDAADFLCLYGGAEYENTYDVVATVFFLDTAPNLIRYLQVIMSCLKPGGVLVNFGPLLWHFENHVHDHGGYDGDGDDGEMDSRGIADPGSFELTDDEVIALVETMGFVVELREGNLPAPYVSDDRSMLKMTYGASHWVARKPDLK
ncbi:N2227-domain-containing protein [Hypoxylon sp. FL1284]|nr:N2227-domain-containing protein [Hypoxylon sp. FL1284]